MRCFVWSFLCCCRSLHPTSSSRHKHEAYGTVFTKCDFPLPSASEDRILPCWTKRRLASRHVSHWLFMKGGRCIQAWISWACQLQVSKSQHVCTKKNMKKHNKIKPQQSRNKFLQGSLVAPGPLHSQNWTCHCLQECRDSAFGAIGTKVSTFKFVIGSINPRCQPQYHECMVSFCCVWTCKEQSSLANSGRCIKPNSHRSFPKQQLWDTGKLSHHWPRGVQRQLFQWLIGRWHTGRLWY